MTRTVPPLSRPYLTPAQRAALNRINAEGIAYFDGRQRKSIDKLVLIGYVLSEWTFHEDRQKWMWAVRARVPATHEVWNNEKMQWDPCCERCSARVAAGGEEPRYPRDVSARVLRNDGLNCTFTFHTSTVR